MLGDKQVQSTEGGSAAIQAGRDINIQGLSFSEVRELCLMLLRDNFPKLKEEARRTAEEHVRLFANGLEQRLANDAASIALEKFKDPDVQAAINDAVLASARKGAAANPNILATLISERVAPISSDFKDIVLSEAVQVVPKLTAQQIALLSFVHAVRSIVCQGLTSAAGLEPFGQIALVFCTPAFGISESQKQHLQYSGTASVNNLLGGDIFAQQSEEYKYLGLEEGSAAFQAELKNTAPTYFNLLEQFNKDRLHAINLTSVGQAIAIANISNFIGKLDYGIWLK
jgi:hypothetical protein